MAEQGRRFNEMVQLCRSAKSYNDVFWSALSRVKGSMAWDDIRNADDRSTFLMWLVRRGKFNLLSSRILSDPLEPPESFLRTTDDHLNTLLNHAVDGGNLGGAVLVLGCAGSENRQLRALLDTPNRFGDYPLAFAVHQHDREMVQLLLFSGARILPEQCVIQALHQAADWERDPVIFGMLIRDLEDSDKYSQHEVDWLLNASTTFCETHGGPHTLWDYLFTGPHHAKNAGLVQAVLTLVQQRDLKPPGELL